MALKLTARLIAVAVLALCSGCAALASSGSTSGLMSGASSAAASDMVSSPSVFDFTAGSTEVAFMSPAALLTEHSRIEESIRHEQCYFKTPDPMFFVPDEDRKVKWAFAGRLDPDRHFRALEYRSVLTLGLMDSNTQLNTWPVQLVSLADMPQVFLDQRLALPAKAKLPSSEGQELVQSYLEQSQHIQGVVTRLEASFNPAVQCNGRRSAQAAQGLHTPS